MTFKELSEYFQKIEATSSRISMTQLLAQLFQQAEPEEIGKICYLLQGRVVPLYEAREFGVADKFMIRAIAQATGVTPKVAQKEYKKVGDVGVAAQNLHQIHKAEPVSVNEVYRQLFALTQMGGAGSQEQKIIKLSQLLAQVDALSARYIARIPLDKLRLGFSDMTILDALSWMLTGGKSLRVKLEEAYNVRPDIGYLAQTVRESGIKGLSHVRVKVGAPILAALCQRLPSADEMIVKMGKVAVEPKYDGVRVQIHYEKSKVKGKRPEVNSYSRNLENTTAMFPELTEIGKQLNAHEVILDSEAVGVEPGSGKLIPFQETMTRKRKYEIEKTRGSVPLKFFVFDILYRDGKDLLTLPLFERRKALEATVKKGNILVVSPQTVTESADELRRYHDEQLKHGLEGVVVKKLDSAYEPGRRGYSWVKFKEEEGKTGKLADTIDGLVLGYYRGQGKRVGFGIGAFLVGVRQEDGFVTITKVGTGVSDKLWHQLQAQLHKLQARVQPKQYLNVNKIFVPDVWVEPRVVVEIAGDDLTKSPTHGAGVAVRFPRLVRIRSDKSPQEVTTVAETQQMYRNQKNASTKR